MNRQNKIDNVEIKFKPEYNTRCEEHSREQFGFRGELGTREDLFFMNTLIQKLKKFQKPLYICVS